MKLPKECQNMHDIREGIDQLDRTLVELLAKRLAYIERAATLKPHSKDVYLPDRFEDVVVKVRAHAETHGLPPYIVEALWRALMTMFTSHEMTCFVKKSEEEN